MTNETQWRKKPVVIDAKQYVPGGQSLIEAWMIGHGARGQFGVARDCVLIVTLEGTMEAQPYDWIVRGVKGEFYPCKPDIFAATYEPASPSPPAGGGEPVAWVPQAHLDFLAEGRAENRPSNALVHDRPNEEMGWTVPLYTSPDAAQQRIRELEEALREVLNGHGCQPGYLSTQMIARARTALGGGHE